MEYLTPEPLDPGALRRAVSDPASGAVLVFEGTVRDHSEGLTGVENRGQGRKRRLELDVAPVLFCAGWLLE